MATTTGLQKYDAARKALAEARTVDELKDIEDFGERMRLAGIQAKNHDLEIWGEEIRLRARRRLGEMIAEQKKAGLLPKGGRPKTGVKNTPVSRPIPLAEVGIDKNLAKEARRLAALDTKTFEIELAKWRADQAETEAGKVSRAFVKRLPKPEPKPKAPKVLNLTPTEPERNGSYSVGAWAKLTKEERADIIASGFEAKNEGMNEQKTDSIEWARFSHNTVTGCLHGCPYCYARDIAERMYPQGFAPTFHPNRLAGPGSVKVPPEAQADASYCHVFANSMSDLFGQWVPVEWIDATIEMARRNPKWQFLTLTKFPQRAVDFDFPENWWMGTTVDAQCRVKNAEESFIRIRCKTKWLSVEPLLGSLRFERLDLFQWIVIGGASSSTKTRKHIPHERWIASLLMQADAAGLPIYQKTNLQRPEETRLREFPWRRNKEEPLAKELRYIKGLK